MTSGEDGPEPSYALGFWVWGLGAYSPVESVLGSGVQGFRGVGLSVSIRGQNQ